MNKGRNIGEVIDRVVALLDQDSDAALRQRLHRTKERAIFCAPEMMPFLWRDATTELNRSATSAHPNYAQIVAIWNDTEPKS